MLSMIPYNRREANLFRYMDELEKNFFNASVNGDTQFRCDISEKDGSYLMEAELPGFDKEDINVELEGDTLTISATHKEESSEKGKDGGYIRRERRFGAFSRSFDVSGVKADEIKADYKNGVLELTLPKKTEEAPGSRKIAIGS